MNEVYYVLFVLHSIFLKATKRNISKPTLLQHK